MLLLLAPDLVTWFLWSRQLHLFPTAATAALFSQPHQTLLSCCSYLFNCHSPFLQSWCFQSPWQLLLWVVPSLLTLKQNPLSQGMELSSACRHLFKLRSLRYGSSYCWKGWMLILVYFLQFGHFCPFLVFTVQDHIIDNIYSWILWQIIYLISKMVLHSNIFSIHPVRSVWCFLF